MTGGNPDHDRPDIWSIGPRGMRRSLRPRFIVVVPHGDPAPDKAVLYEAGRLMVEDLRALAGWAWNRRPGGNVVQAGQWWVREGQGRLVDIYRGQASALAAHPGAVPASMLEPRPVSREEINHLFDICPDLLRFQTSESSGWLEGRVRLLRGDLVVGDGDLILRSPWNFSRDQAERAAMLTLQSEHVVAGIYEEHGRWVYYRGLGSHLVIEGTADTQEEARMMARACLLRAWLEAVERIRQERGGTLDWGVPLPSPEWRDIGHPQASYRMPSLV